MLSPAIRDPPIRALPCLHVGNTVHPIPTPKSNDLKIKLSTLPRHGNGDPFSFLCRLRRWNKRGVASCCSCHSALIGQTFTSMSRRTLLYIVELLDRRWEVPLFVSCCRHFCLTCRRDLEPVRRRFSLFLLWAPITRFGFCSRPTLSHYQFLLSPLHCIIALFGFRGGGTNRSDPIDREEKREGMAMATEPIGKSASGSRIECDFPRCNQRFGRKTEMKRHRLEQHTPRKVCPVQNCRHTVKRGKLLVGHLEKKHGFVHDGMFFFFLTFVIGGWRLIDFRCTEKSARGRGYFWRRW